MITSQIESIAVANSLTDFDSFLEFDIEPVGTVVLPSMTPPETPFPMRRQPTPMLIGPLRWSIWSLATQFVSNLVRRSRYSLGYERD